MSAESAAITMYDESVQTSEFVRRDKLSLSVARDTENEATVFRGPQYVQSLVSRDADGAAHQPPLKEEKLSVKHCSKKVLTEVVSMQQLYPRW